ncbi:MAG: phosphoribosylamine--glycine ligase [Candidatus Anaerobiospirillum pullicola]|uniref:Phosphoribosylamine--glycine ligase n=1 Tax=Candidatus Anaerobiospirillum pullicola TaxID=2838451 RepID=A0A948TG34_9GAMM|nr:phosphoribosylamine--glycine ligase [Candidatus Anaerobiospirillum pullicola]
MRVLVVGNGGREHALAWRAAQSPLAEIVYVAPGNPGTKHEPKMENVDIDVMDIQGLVNFAQKAAIDLTIVGPEAPLVAGIVDAFKSAKLKIFGPSAAAAQLEGSKSFTKDFLKRHNIPTAAYEVFTEVEPAIAYIKEQGTPIVIKADGLAAGKGVVVAMNEDEAIAAVKSMLEGNAFGQAGARVVIEEFMEGEEASFIVMSDGEFVVPMATSQDHKRVGDGDTGPNTGGMGAYSPAPIVTHDVYQKVMERIIEPTIKGMDQDGNTYVGFLYAGLMIDKNGDPRVVEFNCRFGDPETQPIMLRMTSDLVELCAKGCKRGGLEGKICSYDAQPAVGVVLAAEGYPQAPRKGDEIFIDPHSISSYGKVFHAGTKIVDGKLVTNGGRVLCATAMGPDIAEATRRAYGLINHIQFNGMFYRHDIAHRALERLEQSKKRD